MNEKYNVYLVSDSTGETLDRIFLSLKSQFSNFDYDKKEFIWHRPPYANDPIWNTHKIIGYTPTNTRMNTADQRYRSCFQAFELN